MLKIVDLDSPEAADETRFGGKSAGLARLAAAGARVPEGFTVEATRTEPQSWPDDSRVEFCRRAKQLLGDSAIVVRSSARADDGSERSFAGIFDTVLGVGSASDALDAATHCIASGDSSRVYAYAGPGDPVPVGVVVQHQLRTHAAGICFTHDPTGLNEALVVEAFSGSGGRLALAQIGPEHWQVRRGRRGRLEACRREAGDEPPLLRPAEVVEVGREARRLADRLGFPLELEWARDADGRLWWLQANPITTAVDPYLLEVARGASPVDEGAITVWSDLYLREALPVPLAPLVWSLWRDRFLPVLLRAVAPTATPERLRQQLICIDRVGGRIYWNLNGVLALPMLGPALLRLAGRTDPAASARIAELRRSRALTRRRLPGRWKLWLGLLVEGIRRFRHTCWTPEQARTRLDALADRLRCASRRPLGPLTGPQLLAEIRWLTDPDHLGLHRLLGAALFGHGVFEAARFAFRDHPEAQRRLAVGVGNHPGAEMSLAMGELLDRARPLADLFEPPRPAAALIATLQEHSAGQEFLACFDSFLERNGQRGPKELDLSTPRWSEQPDSLFSLLRAQLRDPPKESIQECFARLHQERAETIEIAIARSPLWCRGLMRWLADAVARSAPLPEAALHHGLLALRRVRQIVLEIGARLAAQGSIEDPEDVFFFDWRELEAWFSGRAQDVDWPARIRERRAALAHFASEPAPRFVRSDGVPVTEPGDTQNPG